MECYEGLARGEKARMDISADVGLSRRTKAEAPSTKGEVSYSVNWEVIQGESLEAMRGMADGSFALIVADPPYFKVKDDDWDNQWKTKTEFLAWIRLLCVEWQRLLKPNGSLYVFASAEMSAHVEVAISTTFNVLNAITWAKPCPKSQINYGPSNSGRVNKEALRSYYPNTERLVFAEHYDADSIAKGEMGYEAECDELRGFVFESLRAYLDNERERAGISRARMDTEWQRFKGSKGCMTPHWFGSSQWHLLTEETYIWMRSVLGQGFLSRDYEDLRREYEGLRREYEDLRRPFNATTDVPYTDVWTFPTVGNYKGKHPCEKPLEMMRHIVKVSSREGDAVLDSFAGSFGLGVAALGLNRSYVGVDGSAHWCEQGRRKLSLFGKQGSVTLHSVVEFKRANERVNVDRLLPLFENVA